MQSMWKRSIWLFNPVLVAIVAHFVSVHAHHWHLDRASEVEVAEAQMVGCFLELNLGHWTIIEAHAEENWTSCGNSGVVRDKEEIKDSVSLLFNNHLVNNCAW